MEMVPKVLFICHAKDMLAGYVCGQNFGNKRHLNSHQKSQLIKAPKDFGILGLSAQILGHYENQAKHYSKK